LIFAKDDYRDVNLEIANDIKNNKSPKMCRMLGRKIKGYDEDIWSKWRYDVVLNCNYLQFTQNEAMKKILLESGTRQICEASSYDAIWGIGYAENNAEANRQKWGLNLLGTCLMQIRELIK